VAVTAAQLSDVKVPGGTITENGLRMNVSVGIQYIESWMRGTGAAAINNLMEDVATAEISRSQVWQWVKHSLADDEMSQLRERYGEEVWAKSRFSEARQVFEEVALSKEFHPFLTLVALSHIS
ncbi:MAG: malate synthase A, partial [Chloroflexi bacterium]